MIGRGFFQGGGGNCATRNDRLLRIHLQIRKVDVSRFGSSMRDESCSDSFQ